MQANNKHVKKIRAAFTLMEMMMVLSIIALLIGVGAVTYRNVIENGKITTAEAQVLAIKTAVMQYQTVNRGMPPDLEALVKPPQNARSKNAVLSKSGIIDPWGTKYQFRSPAKKSAEKWEVYSWGGDQKESEDDIYAVE